MELQSVHNAYEKELKRVYEKHQIELDKIQQEHRNEIKEICAENSSKWENLKSLYEKEVEKIKNNHEYEIKELKEQFESRLNDLKDDDLDTLKKRLEDDITKTHAKHKKIVSCLINEIYKLKKIIISSSFDDERLSSIDSIDPKFLKTNSNGHDTDVETSDYVLSQDSIDMQIKDLEDIVQERDDLRSVAMTLRQLSKYLCSFLVSKQEELNNSIIEHMNGIGGDKIMNGSSTIELIDTYENHINEVKIPKKVHFIPNIGEIVSLIDENSILADFTNLEGNTEETNNLELNACLKKLNEEAATLSSIINNEETYLDTNSEDVCFKTFFDKKIEYYKQELEKQKSDYKRLYLENSALKQENVLLKEKIRKDTSFVDYKQQCDDENEHLILLQQKVQELIKNYDDWPNLQNLFEEFSSEYNKIIDNLKNEKDDIAEQLVVADRRLKSSQKFIKDQIAEREAEREEYDLKLELLKCQLKEREKESLDTEDFKSHTEQVVIEAEERYSKLEEKCLKTEELLSASKLEVQSLEKIIFNMELKIENLLKNEMSQKNSINQLTNMLNEEQNNQLEMLTELNRMKNVLEEEPSQIDCPESADIEIVINKIRLQLKDVEKTISKRIKDLDTFWVSEECGSPMSEDISVAERCELSNIINIEKNSSPARIVATLDDVFIRIQERLNRLYKSEDAIFKHESDQQIIVNKLNKQIKSLESEVDMLRTRLNEKTDQLTTAKMKIDELRVLKNDNINSATSQLQEKLQKMTSEYKQCSQVMEEQNMEMKRLKDSIKYLKNIQSVYESKLAEKENIDPNTINSLESKVINLVEENMNLQIELADKVTQIETLSTRLNNLQCKDLSQNVGSNYNRSTSKSMITDTHMSENEQMRRAIPNESNTLASLQMSYHQDVSIREPLMLNLSLPSPLTNDNINVQNSISEEFKSALANAKLELEEKTALIKVMEKDTERMKQQLKELKDTIEILNLEKQDLENNNRALVENEAVLLDKFNNAVIQLEKKQETLAELETLGIKLRAEIQPLEYMKDTLEKKISAFKDCNKIQLERIECLENINEELKSECNQLKKNQIDLNEIKSLQQDNWTLKNELLNTEKFKLEVAEKLEELKNEYDQLKNKNVALNNNIENLKLDKDRLKSELEKNIELHRDELIGYQNLLAEEQNNKHLVNMKLLKTIEELSNQVSEQQKLMTSIQENKEFEMTSTLSDFASENITSNSPKNAMKVLEIDLEHEQKKNSEHEKEIQDKNAEIEHLNYIKKFQEEKIADYILRIKEESNNNTKLELTLTKLENYVKELENKIEIFRAKEFHEINTDNMVKKLEKDLTEVLNTNEMLDKELTRILDIKEKTDEKLIEAYKEIAEFETYKKERNILSEELESKNEIIEAFKFQLNDAETALRDHQTRADEDKRLFELKIIEFQSKIKNTEQKYKDILSDYEVMKSYVIKKQQITEGVQSIFEKNDDLELKLEDAEKNATEWEKRYNELLNENRDIKNKFENLNAEFCHLQNKLIELQNKLSLSDHYKNRLKSDIRSITLPENIELKNTKIIVKLETENASLTKKLTEVREKYNKCRAHLEEIKTMITNQNLKNIVQENIDLCNTRDKLQKEVFELKYHCQDLSKKLLVKGENHWPIITNQPITKVEGFYQSLVWQKMYLVKLARGKDKLLRFITQEAPDLDKNTIKTIKQILYAKKKMSKFKIVVICLIAIRRMKMITMKHVQSQLNVTHYSLPKKMPWIKC